MFGVHAQVSWLFKGSGSPENRHFGMTGFFWGGPEPLEKGISGKRDFFGGGTFENRNFWKTGFWGGPGTFEKGISGRRDFWGGAQPRRAPPAVPHIPSPLGPGPGP